MIGWSGGTSLEERLAEVAVGLLAALLGASVLVWAAGEVAGLLTHGTWPPLGVGDAPAVAIAMLQHPVDPTAGWPASARRVAPPARLYYGVLSVLLVTLLAGALAVAGQVIGVHPDHRAARRVPPGLRRRPGTRRLQRPFLAWSGTGPFARLLTASPEDGVAVVGPPRVGKTQGVLIPQVLLWAGAVISASTKTDVIQATAENRRTLASEHGGRIMLWAPTATNAPPAAVEAIGWSPLSGCESAETCERRVRALVAASGAGLGARHADHWRDNAVRVLRGCFHAAALERLGVRGVLRWLARNELREPSIVLEHAATPVGESWADELEGMTRVPAEELGSILSAARTALGALQNGRVRESCDRQPQFHADELLLTRSTLYVAVLSADQELLAPLAAALIEHVIQRAYELWDLGRLPARLLLNLDELANIAPLPSLLKILTQGGGRGVNLTWAVQSLAQLRDRYGEQVADAAFSSSRARLVFGGLTDTRDLQAISQLAGEHEVPARSLTRGAQAGQASMTAGTVWRPKLPVSAVRGIPAGRAVLLYHTSDPALVRVLPAHRTRLWQRAAEPTATTPDGRPGPILAIVASAALRWRSWRRRRG